MSGPRPRTTRPESRASIAPCIRWPPWSRGHLLAVVYGEIERPAPYLRKGLWLSVVRRASHRPDRTATASARHHPLRDGQNKERARSRLTTPRATWARPPTEPTGIALP